MYTENDIFLRPLHREDAFISYLWRNDAQVWKYTAHRPDRLITPEIELQWIDRVLVDKTRKCYAICLTDSNKYVGNIQITGICDAQGEFHIFIGDRSVWGKGIASAATALLLKKAKHELHLKKLELWVNMENHAAVKVYLKNGFTHVDNMGKMEIIL